MVSNEMESFPQEEPEPVTIGDILACKGAECYQRNAKALRDKRPAISFITSQRGDIVDLSRDEGRQFHTGLGKGFVRVQEQYHGVNMRD